MTLPGPRITCKPGVLMASTHPVTLRGLADLADLWDDVLPQHPFVVTSLTDGTHVPDSRHYLGLAFDVRTHGAPQAHLELIVRRFKAAHPGWWVKVETPGIPGEHLHAEWRPAN